MSQTNIDAGATSFRFLSLINRCTESSADSTADTDDAIAGLMDFIRLHHSEFVNYFEQHVVSKIQNNMQVLATNGWIARG